MKQTTPATLGRSSSKGSSVRGDSGQRCNRTLTYLRAQAKPGTLRRRQVHQAGLHSGDCSCSRPGGLTFVPHTEPGTPLTDPGLQEHASIQNRNMHCAKQVMQFKGIHANATRKRHPGTLFSRVVRAAVRETGLWSTTPTHRRHMWRNNIRLVATTRPPTMADSLPGVPASEVVCKLFGGLETNNMHRREPG